eukprot:CAMPEP_0178829168 /NCGR_PEP_ID=MMETSP0746-20121128/8225_1 /TAXON_ID=913974 /ORGANISM="Nitzschia punctata, Strain CCMP561" /LENGTH=225 /DNA_ID=CAMNT_0020491209 /DNA_START=32 /DNA_END=705 /DNA_ORIENTATION=+
MYLQITVLFFVNFAGCALGYGFPSTFLENNNGEGRKLSQIFDSELVSHLKAVDGVQLRATTGTRTAAACEQVADENIEFCYCVQNVLYCDLFEDNFLKWVLEVDSTDNSIIVAEGSHCICDTDMPLDWHNCDGGVCITNNIKAGQECSVTDIDGGDPCQCEWCNCGELWNEDGEDDCMGLVDGTCGISAQDGVCTATWTVGTPPSSNSKPPPGGGGGGGGGGGAG